ncbi:G-type lectin S-receptor-like serine/threonine-protein kinase LECRK1 [Salvia miltiorrhiza]|uniref:G-type lectin S-receptor-like serine/threonine-protein kinase LECRK1 n=1 Tax=Salvia miltiorrhiza TaxID=226208 RepID=UPI0025AD87C2|nr:G-type lectin S-receptor-like serine/threonine-protein kinase LECRK1 [Salvia miltiorrhiza]
MALTSSLLFTIIIIIAFPVSTTAQQSSNRNITLGSSIVANADASHTWTSPSGEFAFGFRQVAPGAFLLAIWFDQLPDKTLVWSANRDAPVPTGSTVQLSTDGSLVLIHQRSGGIWRADPSQPARVAYAAMLDTGNFVLATNISSILWGSFDQPTDTLLPTQLLNRDVALVSTVSETNYSTGKFRMRLQTDGNLVLNTVAFPSPDPYWSSQTQTLESGVRLLFNQSGSIIFIRQNGTLIRPLFNNSDLVGQFHQRLTLEYDGVLRRYVYPKSANSSMAFAWTARGFVPSNICHDVREAHTGGGACGFNSICKMEADGRPSCGCPPGYSSRGGLAGCAPNFAPHRCDQQSEDAQDFIFEDIYNIDWPEVDIEV